MTFIDGTVVNVALPALQKTFGASVVDVQWVVESYALLLGALILAGGSLGDIFGRRKVFLCGVFVFALASAWCGLAPDVHWLIVARAVQGLGAAFLVPGSLAIISASFDEASRGKAIGTWSAFTAITTAIGPVLGGWLIEHASWRWAFLINVPLAAAVIVISWWRVPESRGPAGATVDWMGAALATLGLGGLVYGLIESARLGWHSAQVLATIAVGMVCLLAFMRAERTEKFPMVPLTLFRSWNFSGANLLTLFLYAALSMFFFVYPLNLIQVQGYSATATGGAAIPFIVLMFLLSRWSGGLVAKYGPKLPLIVGPLLAALGFLLFAVPGQGGSYWTTFFPAFVVLGLGMTITVAPLTTVVMNSVEQARAGTASGINNAVSRVSGLLAVAVIGVVMVAAFGRSLEQRVAPMQLPPAASQQLQGNVTQLGALKTPAGVDSRQGQEVRDAIAASFVEAFRVVMGLCAGLAIISAGAAWGMVGKEVRTLAANKKNSGSRAALRRPA
jgi:EmrB/QacA subfamily drug resistance transporter